MSSSRYTTQNDLLLKNLLEWYNKDDNLNKMLSIINGESAISLRIVDWFVTNFAKKILQFIILSKKIKLYVLKFTLIINLN